MQSFIILFSYFCTLLYIFFLRRNLKHCPESCRKTAYLALVRSTLEYSSIVWDPYLQKDINKLEKVQRQAARFIIGDYSSKDQGCVTRMLDRLKLPSLQDRRESEPFSVLLQGGRGAGASTAFICLSDSVPAK